LIEKAKKYYLIIRNSEAIPYGDEEREMVKPVSKNSNVLMP